jgi:hypothetical protein
VITIPWQPHREPVTRTLARTVTIAAVLGAIFAASSRTGLARWPQAFLIMLWPALGGHFVEVFFLNHLRPRLPFSRSIQIAARIATWFVGGCLLMAAMQLTNQALGPTRPVRRSWPQAWWLGGLGFIALELFVHVILRLRRIPNFYDARA